MDIALQLAAGLVLLAIGGEGVVRGAVDAARQLRVSELLIGLTLVGFGTSTPELLTSINAALRGSDGVAVGNVVGSNISNVLLIFALCAAVRPVPVARRAVLRDGAVMVATSLAFAAYALANPHIGRLAGAAMLGALGLYMWFAFRAERAGAAGEPIVGDAPSRARVEAGPLVIALGMSAAGLAALIFGADLLVRGAVSLAKIAGLSETVIGLTIVAVGTSLPELVATLAAALRGRAEVAFGNIVGSNIYNVLGVLGVTALVRPIAIPADIGLVDWAAFTGGGALLLFHAWTGARVGRVEGASLFALYLAFVVYLLAGAPR